MAEASTDNLISGDNDVPRLDTKRQKLLKCILNRNSKLDLGKGIWVRSTQKNILTNLAMKKWISFLIITKQALRPDGKVFGEINHQYVFNGSLCSFRNKQSGYIE